MKMMTKTNLNTHGTLKWIFTGEIVGLLFAGAVFAQVTGDPTCDVGGYPLPAGGIAIENALDFPGGYPGDGLSGTWSTPDMAASRIDRRPVHGFNLSQAQWVDAVTNPLGLNPAGWDDDSQGVSNPVHIATGFVIPSSVVWLRDELEAIYDEGWRRVVVWNPAGIIPGDKMASGQWWTMSDVKRQGLELWLEPWLAAHPDFSLGVWAGFRLTDECTIEMGNRRTPDSRNVVDMTATYRNVHPWFDIAGISEYWFDAAVPVQNAVRVIRSPDLDDLKIGLEVPYMNTPGTPGSDLKTAASPKAPWVATLGWYEWAENNSSIHLGCIKNDWVVDPATTEFGVFIRSFGDIDNYWKNLNCITCPLNDPQCSINYFSLGFDDAVAITNGTKGDPDTVGEYTGVTMQVLEDWRDRGFVLWTNRLAWRPMVALVTPKSVQSFSPAIDVAALAANTELCLADLDRDGSVGSGDVSIILALWGLTDVAAIDGDLNYSGAIDSGDLAIVMASWGACSSVTLPMNDPTCRVGSCP